MATLERDGETLSYQVTGSGQPILLGHSLLCGSWMWQPLVADLSRRFTVINCDFRGHGASTASRAFTLDDLVDDWLELLDRLACPPAILIGLSMGGMTAMRLALRAPERVKALVLIDTSAAAEPFKKRLEYGLLSALYSRFGFSDFLASRVIPIMLGKTVRRLRPEIISELTERVRQCQPGPLIHAIRAVVQRNDILRTVDRIKCPSLVLVGEEDVATPVMRSREIQQRLSGSRLVLFPGLGHLSAWEQPARVGQEILGFLDSLR